MSEDKFTPKIIRIDLEGYKIAQAIAEKKLKALDDLRLEYIKQTKSEIIDFKALSTDANIYATETIYNSNKDLIKIDIAPAKMLDLLDINLSHLKHLQDTYNAIECTVTIVGNLPSVKVLKDDFTIWTQTPAQNEMLKIANDFIQASKMVSTIAKTYILNLSQGTSNMVIPNYRTNEIEINASFILGNVR